MSFEIDNMCQFIQPVIQNNNIDELEEFFSSHSDLITPEIVNKIFGDTCKVQRDFNDYEPILNFLLLLFY